MKYQADFLSAEEEQTLLRDAENLPFREFEFHGFTGKRRTISFGWRYDFNGGGLTKTDDMPEFLIGLRGAQKPSRKTRPAAFSRFSSQNIRQAPVSAGTRTARCLATSSAFHCAHHAFSGCGGDSGIALSGSPSMRSRVLFTSCAASRAPNGSIVFPGWKRFGIPLHFATYVKGPHSGPDLDAAKTPAADAGHADGRAVRRQELDL